MDALHTPLLLRYMPLRPESPDTAIRFWILRCTHRTVQAHTHPVHSSPDTVLQVLPQHPALPLSVLSGETASFITSSFFNIIESESIDTLQEQHRLLTGDRLSAIHVLLRQISKRKNRRQAVFEMHLLSSGDRHEPPPLHPFSQGQSSY